jgi:hypothetical protein
MQFIPSTWAVYGLGGDVHDPHDAVLGAANYLDASGAPGDYRVALCHFNPVPEYVDAVTRYARQMTRDPRTFYAYYNWQVFVLTQHGDSASPAPALEPGCDSECCAFFRQGLIYLHRGPAIICSTRLITPCSRTS